MKTIKTIQIQQKKKIERLVEAKFGAKYSPLFAESSIFCQTAINIVKNALEVDTAGGQDVMLFNEADVARLWQIGDELAQMAEKYNKLAEKARQQNG